MQAIFHRRTLQKLLIVLLLPASCLFAQAQQKQAGAHVAQLMQSGASALHDGNTTDAERYFTQATVAAPHLADAFLGLGLVQLREGKPDAAEKSLTKALALNPKLQGVHMFLGIAKYQMNDAKAASDNLREEIRLQPKNAEALTWLGIVELGAGNPEKATAPLDQAAALDPKDANILYLRGRAHSLVAQESYQSLYKLDPDSWRVHHALGESYSASGDSDKAIAEFLKALDKQPGDPDIYESLGNEYQKVSRFDDAIKAYEQELKFNPHNGIALYNLGKIQVERGDPKEGVPLLEEAVHAHASLGPSSYYLGLGLSKLGKNQEAAEWMERSLQQNPSDFIKQGAYYELARVYQRLNRKQDSLHALDELKKLKDKEAAAAIGAPSQP